MKLKSTAFYVCTLLVLTLNTFGQTPGQIHDQSSYSEPNTSTTYNPMDPDENGWASVNNTGYISGKEDDQIDWIGIPQLTIEPDNDTDTGGGCGSTDIMDKPTGGEASYVYFDNQGSTQYLIYRIRLARNPSGAFGYSILVDTDGRIGGADPNAVAKNPGFEYEVRISLQNNDAGTVTIENIDGIVENNNNPTKTYSQATNFQKVTARFTDSDCSSSTVQFFDFFIDIADMGLTSSSSVRLAAATSTQPSKGVLSNVSDISGIDDRLIGDPTYPVNQDSTFIELINLQSPTPISQLGPGGCLASGYSQTPIVFEPIFDSNSRINGYVDEPEGAFVTVFTNDDTLGTSLVTSTGFWSVSFDQGDLRPFDEITAIVRDSCELKSASSAVVNVINDVDSDDDGILDIDEGNGEDPGGDADGDDIPNYLDTDYPGFVDLNNDGINDNFDPDGDGIPSHFDTDSNGDGITDHVAIGGTYDGDNDGVIDTMEDSDGDGVPDSVDADNQSCTDNIAVGGAYPDGICDIYQSSTYGGGGSATDSDGDGIANEYDPDDDGDGLASQIDTDEGGTALVPTDMDNDGLPNHLDADSDGDGIPDTIESTTTDSDGDGYNDFVDIDSDNDGILDYIEAQSTNSPVSPSGIDTDGDGLDDSFDTDNGGASLSSPTNTDGTDNPDYLDSDSDNDGVADIIEGNDANFNGVADISLSGNDANNDGLDDNFDPDNGGTLAVQQDTDGDGIPDFRDTDDDDDGILTSAEDSDTNSNWANDFTQGGGTIPDYLFNPDNDRDGVWDVADLDSDNDGILDTDEDGGTGFDPSQDADNDGIPNYLDLDDITYSFETDTNGDGIVDAYDFDMDGIPDFKDLDSDNDGITDVIEAGGTDADQNGRIDGSDSDSDGLIDTVDNVGGAYTSGTPLTIPDSDGDGNYNPYDIDSDNDGIVDNIEAQNSASYIAPSGNDSDRDGLDDNYELVGGTYLVPVNTDGTGEPDYLDLDADGDGRNDIIEGDDFNHNGKGDWDTNGNGVVNGAEGTGDTDGDGLLDAFDSDNVNFNSTGTNIALQDTDGDGTKDFQDTDDDNDGISTLTEGYAFTQGGGTIPDYLFNPDWDGDGINNVSDLDSDNDGILDIDENGGVVDETGAGSGQQLSPTDDRDGDGIQNYLDLNDNNFTATDSNGDGVVDEFDSDLDGLPDFLDLDSDNDGVLDIVEAGGVDTDYNGIVDTFADTDGDGYANLFDSDNGGTPLSNPDTDGDGVHNAFDLDSDNDGLTDITENGGTDADGDGRADDATDTDGDGIADIFDTDSSNSPLSTLDTDSDGKPNYKDLDSDNDGIVDTIEAGGTDANGDGKLDSFVDTDNDGLNDVVDTDNGGTALANTDTDGDGKENYIDIDSDADGIPDIIEAQTTVGYLAPTGVDTDGDGIDNRYDPTNGGTALVPVNTDGKTGADYIDTDSDNDGISDLIEGNDSNHNGVADATPTGVDTDGDGLDDAFDTNNSTFDPDGSNVALQDLDSDSKLDYRDTDDDADGIYTIDEPLDLNPVNGTKDYLEDNVGSCGIRMLTTDFDGNADDVYSNSGVTSSTEALGSGDAVNAVFNDIGDIMILDLTDVIPNNRSITITFKSSASKSVVASVTSSTTASGTYSNAQNISTSSTTYGPAVYTVNNVNGIRYLKFNFTSRGSGNPNLLLDAVSYQFTQCDDDWDMDGVKDSEDNDDDNDGIPDIVEVNSALLGDEDGDGILNFEDTGYTGFLDANGDGIDDDADFDNDGIPNHLDLDSDSDGINDATEANGGELPTDMLEDGRFSIAYVLSNDFDGDGLANIYDVTDGGTEMEYPDTDADGTNPDFLDIDSDADGQKDFAEGYDDDLSGDALNDYTSRAAAFETAASNPGYYTTADGDLDGIPNWLEIGANGIPQFLDPTYGDFYDTDGDGIVDLFDYTNFGEAYNAPDFDMDGLPDYRDTDHVITLPVSLISFTSEITASGVLLKWATVSEFVNDHFTLSRSASGQSFEQIAIVKGAGNSTSTIKYEYLDKLKMSGTYYYQLAQTDFDGTETILETIRVEFHEENAVISIYPNPVDEIVTIDSELIHSGNKIEIVGLSGKSLRVFELQEDDQVQLNIKDLPKGILILRIHTSDKIYQKKIIHQ